MVKQTIKPLNKQTRQKHLSRLYFLSRGCKQVPPGLAGGRVLWAQGEEGYFLNAFGMKLKLDHSPESRKVGRKNNDGKRGRIHPGMRRFGNKQAHRLMFATFADEPCPIFFDSKGNPYKGIVHHVIENPYDIRMDNLLGWLTYKQHAIADKRRRALEAVLPDMYCVETAYLKLLQDPRRPDELEFNMVLNNLHATYAKDNL